MFFITALSIGMIHTLLGPDHYLPFIVIGRARKWGLGKTLALTAACGAGHVLSSVVLGLIGVIAGSAIASVKGWESARGQWASWSILIFGAVYMIWGIYAALKNRTHCHMHIHPDGEIHDHGHHHNQNRVIHQHKHDAPGENENTDNEPASWKSLTPWVLFIIFVLGPCEPLIPLFFASALEGNWFKVILATSGYFAATMLTMLILVTATWYGLSRVNFGFLERWTHALAGGIIALSGIGMVFLGL